VPGGLWHAGSGQVKLAKATSFPTLVWIWYNPSTNIVVRARGTPSPGPSLPGRGAMTRLAG
jgi:hypothetical protein